MAPNPNPGRISDAIWWLAEQLLALEPGTQLGGIHADKPGYHNTGQANEDRWPGDYSIRDAPDRRGPSWRNKAAAIDWTFPEAQRGDYRRMALYGTRLRTAYDTRDLRLAGWREALGQTDTDAAPEGLDFRHHHTRVPDDSHRWHWHFSEAREQVDSHDNKRALLSVLRGQTLTDWLGGASMADDYGRYGRPPHGVADRTTAVMIADLWWQELDPGVSPYDGRSPSARNAQLARIEARVTASTAELAALRGVVEQLAETIRAGGGTVDTAAILAGVDQRLTTLRAGLPNEIVDEFRERIAE